MSFAIFPQSLPGYIGTPPKNTPNGYVIVSASILVDGRQMRGLTMGKI
jgi:hypothetical protein